MRVGGGAQIAFGLIRALSGFFIGVGLYRYRTLLAKVLSQIPVEIVIIVILLYPILPVVQSFQDLFVVIILIPLCVGCAMNNHSWLLENAAMQWLGSISYSIYLWQSPYSLWFASLARQALKLDMSVHNPLIGVLWLASLLVVATVSYHFIEIPSQKLIKRLFHGTN
jgi:peptidoglycan/LPS O-acetylase OafA/YrhL